MVRSKPYTAAIASDTQYQTTDTDTKNTQRYNLHSDAPQNKKNPKFLAEIASKAIVDASIAELFNNGK